MAGKKKFAPRRMKSPKREVGINPAALLGGAAAGAAIGAKVGAKRATRGIARSMLGTPFMGSLSDKRVNVYESKKEDWGGQKKLDRLGTAALNLDKKYTKAKYGSSLDLSRTFAAEQNAKYGGVNKQVSRDILKSANQVSRKRFARKGAAIGGLSGAAITALAQAVARELRKKR